MRAVALLLLLLAGPGWAEDAVNADEVLDDGAVFYHGATCNEGYGHVEHTVFCVRACKRGPVTVEKVEQTAPCTSITLTNETRSLDGVDCFTTTQQQWSDWPECGGEKL